MRHAGAPGLLAVARRHHTVGSLAGIACRFESPGSLWRSLAAKRCWQAKRQPKQPANAVVSLSDAVDSAGRGWWGCGRGGLRLAAKLTNEEGPPSALRGNSASPDLGRPMLRGSRGQAKLIIASGQGPTPPPGCSPSASLLRRRDIRRFARLGTRHGASAAASLA
jgi:hypothetical protein